ncbi:MAG: hypothetical protein MK212_13495 [Saprospiraceae bacterium]|nr:hypothetical protein [Saprospiraceae bacterium]
MSKLNDKMQAQPKLLSKRLIKDTFPSYFEESYSYTDGLIYSINFETAISQDLSSTLEKSIYIASQNNLKLYLSYLYNKLLNREETECLSTKTLDNLERKRLLTEIKESLQRLKTILAPWEKEEIIANDFIIDKLQDQLDFRLVGKPEI